MDKFDEYIREIKEIFNDKIEDIELVSQTNNIVFKANSITYGVVYIKFYLNKSSHIDHEMKLYKLLDKKYLKEVIVSRDDYKCAVFKELKGKTLDELSSKEIDIHKENIINSVIYFYNTVGKFKINGYGLLDEKLNGTSVSFKKFLYNRQMESQNVLKDYLLLNNLFTRIYDKYSDFLIKDNSLVPIDTNLKNIMLTETNEIKFIDPGELISAPILMGYGDFVAHVYKTKLYDCLIKKLQLSDDDMIRLRIYAIFSSLNILAFLKNNGVEELDKVIPYGNTYTFYELINEHLKNIDL